MKTKNLNWSLTKITRTAEIFIAAIILLFAVQSCSKGGGVTVLSSSKYEQLHKGMLRTEIEGSYAGEKLCEFNLIYCNAMVDNVMREISKL
ncbi:MAG: hypothetical protein IPH58_05970 [Sphingobacteriales bacterium]|jgi:hypothetical protein|nr:hypothetical protein [Sphingobacteriales bacterium]